MDIYIAMWKWGASLGRYHEPMTFLTATTSLEVAQAGAERHQATIPGTSVKSCLKWKPVKFKPDFWLGEGLSSIEVDPDYDIPFLSGLDRPITVIIRKLEVT